jgi:hypothetical protein
MAGLSKYIGGVVAGVAENTRAGRILLEPLDSVTTSRERALAVAENEQARADERQRWARQDRRFLTEQRDWARQDRAYEMEQRDLAEARTRMATDDLLRQRAKQGIQETRMRGRSLMMDAVRAAFPDAEALTDQVLANAFDQNSAADQYLDIFTAFRLRQDPRRGTDPAAQEVYAEFLESERLREIEVDGRPFLEDLNTGERFAIDEESFVELHNEIGAQAAREVAARINLSTAKDSLNGRAFAGKAMAYLQADPEDSAERAAAQARAFFERFTPEQLRTHYLAASIGEYLENPGGYMSDSGGELAAQLQFLAQRMGFEWEQAQDGQIMVRQGGGYALGEDGAYHLQPGSLVPLTEFHRDLSARDVVGRAWQDEAERLRLRADPMLRAVDEAKAHVERLLQSGVSLEDARKAWKELLESDPDWDGTQARIRGLGGFPEEEFGYYARIQETTEAMRRADAERRRERPSGPLPPPEPAPAAPILRDIPDRRFRGARNGSGRLEQYLPIR